MNRPLQNEERAEGPEYWQRSGEGYRVVAYPDNRVGIQIGDSIRFRNPREARIIANDILAAAWWAEGGEEEDIKW